ncbi:MAG TPA: bifunctional UDP-N-acetylglucosamine diphosphorylase/glucosamine-1-phosphate N-acetyltransferase GlmU [Gammaproteobacteria bacterium]|nr:bifunctional UDP-N-acetylglucosamine diphosphorylase/glucosamine-1-phosphate N-acetyltransferase GlmU [Gammaproteobacteria bacterium]
MSLSVIILAAGMGTRMRSATPKVLHELAGRSLLGHALAAAEALAPDSVCVVYGHGGDQLRAAFKDRAYIKWREQAPQLGTGHAVMQARDTLSPGTALILYGDVPLIRPQSLAPLLQDAAAGALAVLTAEVEDPTGYGRIVRDQTGSVIAIVEEKDADAATKKIREINSGIMAMPAPVLAGWLGRIDNKNAQAEYYLTDIIALAVADGVTIHSRKVAKIHEIKGINTRRQLAELERTVQRESAEYWMDQGVTLSDPARFDIRGEVKIGRDVVIDVDVILEGKVEIGDNVRIGPFCLIKDAKIGDGAEIHSHCHIEGARIHAGCSVGPFARLRPDTVMHEGAKVGNFVEVKKSVIGEHSKANHLSYIGDAELGRDVNIGAGTITCNYDGANKHKTVIEDGAFIGSDTQLVAPVRIGKDTTIGAGSTITKDTPAGGLTLSRVKQQHVAEWKRPQKNKDKG